MRMDPNTPDYGYHQGLDKDKDQFILPEQIEDSIGTGLFVGSLYRSMSAGGASNSRGTSNGQLSGAIREIGALLGIIGISGAIAWNIIDALIGDFLSRQYEAAMGFINQVIGLLPFV